MFAPLFDIGVVRRRDRGESKDHDQSSSHHRLA
jgi:hypothetical protein